METAVEVQQPAGAVSAPAPEVTVPPETEEAASKAPMTPPSPAALGSVSDEVDYTKENINVVFIGHVDAGKSTISGHILCDTGMVDERTLKKYQQEAKELNRESWAYAFFTDTNDEERAKGKTVTTGRAFFRTEHRHFTLLDAPGHALFVPSMISGACQADVAIMVVSSRKGEFEAGFERGGQTREHTMVAKTCGINQMIVVINKMDDPSVMWSKDRYDGITSRLIPFMRGCGFNPKTDLTIMPISGLKGYNLSERVPKTVCPWYDGPCLLEALDGISIPPRKRSSPLRIPVQDSYKDVSVFIIGKIESGRVSAGDHLILMPHNTPVEVQAVLLESGEEVPTASAGDNIRLKLSGIEETHIKPGMVLCPPDNLCHVSNTFVGKLMLLEHDNVVSNGYISMIHIHAATVHCTIDRILALIDKKSGKIAQKTPPFIKPGDSAIVRMTLSHPVCMEKFEDFERFGRFLIRHDGRTQGIGVIKKVKED